MKSKPLAFLLWCLCLFGICGVHRMYLGRWVSGIVWFLTFGLLFIGQLVDLLFLSGKVDVANALIVGRHLKAGGKFPAGRAQWPAAHGKQEALPGVRGVYPGRCEDVPVLRRGPQRAAERG